MITEAAWLQSRLKIGLLNWRGTLKDQESVDVSVSGDAVQVDYSNWSNESNLYEDKKAANMDACLLVKGFDIPEWVKELHLQVQSGFGSRRPIKFTRTRVDLASVRDCVLDMAGLQWSMPTPTQWEAPLFSDLPLSIARRPDSDP